jgi:RNA polymerase sigma factor (sigma-70 family)
MQFEKSFISRLRQKDEQAFTELYRRTGTMLYNFILYRVGQDAEAAEDILSEVFSDAVSYSTSLTPLHNIEGWLVQIAKSKVVDHYRVLKREGKWRSGTPVETVADDKGMGRDPALQHVSAADQAAVGEAFTALTPKHREVLKRMYVDGQNVKDIACAMGRSEKGIESLLYRARIDLEAKLASIKKRAMSLGRGTA